MHQLLALCVALIVLISVPAISAEIFDRTQCEAEVEALKQKDEDTDVDDKLEIVVKELIEVLEHLCEEKAFSDASDVAGSIRAILEAGEPPDGPKKT